MELVTAHRLLFTAYCSLYIRREERPASLFFFVVRMVVILVVMVMAGRTGGLMISLSTARLSGMAAART
jgi:hypothetical protein